MAVVKRIAINVTQEITYGEYSSPQNNKGVLSYMYERITSTGVDGLLEDIVVSIENSPIPNLKKEQLLEHLIKTLADNIIYFDVDRTEKQKQIDDLNGL